MAFASFVVSLVSNVWNDWNIWNEWNSRSAPLKAAKERRIILCELGVLARANLRVLRDFVVISTEHRDPQRKNSKSEIRNPKF